MLKNLTTTHKQLFWAALTFALYTFLMGWKFAVFIMVAIGFHEMSHLFVAKREGMKTKGVVMLPFIGGVSMVAGQYRSYWQQAKVVLAGPIGGGLLSILVYGLYTLTGIPYLLACAYFMCLINLLNLAFPFSSVIDGGQLLSTILYSINEDIGFYVKAITTVIAIVLLAYFNWVLAIFVGVVGGVPVYSEWKQRKLEAAGINYYKPKKMTMQQIWMTSAIWVVATIVLGGMWWMLKDRPEASIAFLIRNR